MFNFIEVIVSCPDSLGRISFHLLQSGKLVIVSVISAIILYCTIFLTVCPTLDYIYAPQGLLDSFLYSFSHSIQLICVWEYLSKTVCKIYSDIETENEKKN